MNEERRVNLVLVGLRGEGDDAKRRFIQGMAGSFKVAEAKVVGILDRLPFVLSRECTLDEARAMAEKVQQAGGICRLQAPGEETPAAQQQSESTAAEPSESRQEEPSEPAPEEPSEPERREEREDHTFDMPEPPPQSLVGEAKVGVQRPPEPKGGPEPEEAAGTIPLAVPGVGAAGGGSTSAGGQVKCIECGEMQPPGATCRNCHFPLPER